MAQNALEGNLEKLFQQADMKEYFKGHKEYIIVPTDACNESLCDPLKIKAKMPVKFYTMEEAFLRGVTEFIRILKVERTKKEGKTLFLLGIKGNKTIKIEV